MSGRMFYTHASQTQTADGNKTFTLHPECNRHRVVCSGVLGGATVTLYGTDVHGIEHTLDTLTPLPDFYVIDEPAFVSIRLNTAGSGVNTALKYDVSSYRGAQESYRGG